MTSYIDSGDDVVRSFLAGHVPWDLELKRVVRRCRNLVDVIGVTGCHRAHGVHDARAEFHTLQPTRSVERFSCPGFRHVGLDTVAFSVAGSHVDDSAVLVPIPLC